MKAENLTESEKSGRNLAIILIITLFTAVGGAFVGTILAALGGGVVGGWLGFEIRWWHGLLIGGIFGACSGVFQAVSIIRRSRAFSQAVESLGMLPLSDDDTDKIADEVAAIIVGQDVRFWDCHFRMNDGVKIVIGDMGLDRAVTGSDSKSKEKQQTCAYFEFTDFEFPEFELKPEGIGLRMLEKFVGRTDIDFEDSPKFSSSYFLSGYPEESVRRLFSLSVRKMFEQNAGLSVGAKKGQLVIYRLNETCGTAELEGFLNQCLMIAGELQSSGLHIPVEQTVRPAETKASSLAKAEAIGGIMGAMLSREIEKKAITNDAISEFLAHPLPRPIPRQLRNQLRADPFLVVFGTLFTAVALILGVAFVFGADNQEEMWLAVGISSLIFVIGSAILFSVKFFERRRFRLLTHGTVRTATIASVKASSLVMGNERVFDVRLAFSDGAVATTSAKGYAATRAKRFEETGDSLRILQDPADKTKLLLIDCYSIE